MSDSELLFKFLFNLLFKRGAKFLLSENPDYFEITF